MEPELKRELGKRELERAARRPMCISLDGEMVPVVMHCVERAFASHPVRVPAEPHLLGELRRISGMRDTVATVTIGSSVAQLYMLFAFAAVGSRVDAAARPAIERYVMKLSEGIEQAGFPTLAQMLLESLDAKYDSPVPEHLLKPEA
jgi:hypothetical protein